MLSTTPTPVRKCGPFIHSHLERQNSYAAAGKEWMDCTAPGSGKDHLLLFFRNILELLLMRHVLSEIILMISKCLKMPDSATQFQTPVRKSGLLQKTFARLIGKMEFCRF